MDINKLTIGEAREIAALVCGQRKVATHDDGPRPGAYVIVRARDAGVHAGILSSVDYATRTVFLRDSRRLWRWWSRFTLSELAQEGVRKDKVTECKFAVPIESTIAITAWCEIIPVTTAAEKMIREVPDANA